MKTWIALLLICPTAAFAQGSTAETDPAAPGGYQTFKNMDYYCTDSDGNRRELGEVICITASCTTWMARCDLSLTNVMWRKLQDGCPGASLLDRLEGLQPGVDAVPVHSKI